MISMEKEIVNEEFLLREDVYNLKVGGEGGFGYINENKLSPLYPESKNAISKQKRIEDGKKYGKISGLIHKNKIKTDNEYRIKSSSRLKNIGQWVGRRHSKDSKMKIGMANSIKQKGKNNSNYGKCWIFNDTEKKSISVKIEDVKQWIEKGWKKGRKIIWWM